MRRLLGLALALAVLAAGYVATAVWAGARVPDRTSVQGVAVGGLDRASAARRLDAELTPLTTRALTLTAGPASTRLVPAEAGLGVDVNATLDRLTGRTFDPRLIWQHLRGGGPTDIETTRDEARLTAAVADAATSLGQPLTEGSVTFDPAGARLVPSTAGRTVDPGPVRELVASRWLSGGIIRLAATTQPPKIEPQVLQRFYDDVARPATSGPLTVKVGERSVVVPVSRLAPALSTAVTDGVPSLRVDGAALRAIVVELDPRVERRPVEADVVLRGRTPTVVPGQSGQRIEAAAVAAAALPAVTSPQRTATVPAAVVEPDLTTAEAQGLGVREVVSTFTTRFPLNPPRTSNIKIAARTLNGILVRPGELFSLNDALGRRTPAKGYQQAPVIDGGRLTKDYGGGVSQVSTTLFNAVFFAGLDTVTHKPHSFYISRYPEGREATVSFPTVDQTFRNDSGHGIVIGTSVDSSSITVTFYGTTVWDIEATKGPRTDVREPKTIRDSGAGCVAQSPSAGFTVTVGRVFKRGGATVRTERFSTRYIPEDRVICG